VQPESLIKELPFVYQEPRVRAPLLHSRDYLVKGHYFVFERGIENPERKERARQRSRNGHLKL
jgi:hypothetical protein